MKNWIISKKENHSEYFILSENFIGLVLKNNEVDIGSLQNTEYDNTYYFKDIEEIALDEITSTLKLIFKNDELDDKAIKLNKNIFSEIKNNLSENLTNIEVSNYEYITQIIHHKNFKSLMTLIVVVFFTIIFKRQVDSGVNSWFGIRLNLEPLFSILTYRRIFIASGIVLFTLINQIRKSLINPTKGIQIELKQPSKLIF